MRGLLYICLTFSGLLISAESDKHWAFIKPERHSLPKVEQTEWPLNPIDHFVLSKLEEAGIEPSPEAGQTTLLRRVYFDLIGLPPTPGETDKFLDDQGKNAYSKIVDKLLSSKHYGERWGRHWLDLARYADSNGYSHDSPRTIWKYRDWVIDAYNKNLPFDQFIIEQIAGDMLPEATIDQRIATGFHRNTQINTEGGVDKEQFRIDSIFDRVATTGEVFFGLTFGCAQCHDHKFDPISQSEFFQLFAFLNQADEPRIEAPSAGELELIKQYNSKLSKLEIRLKELPENSLARKKLTGEITKHKKTRPRVATTLVMAQRKTPRASHRFVNGDFTRPAEKVNPGTPAILHNFPNTKNSNRLDFAYWIASKNNPLLARVTVNRIWQHYFGIGIVETENDFGTQSLPPSHPKLLDWLATEFMRLGWNQKAIHKLIVTSATYRQSSNNRSELTRADPANKLLGKQSRLRLDAEILRDNALAASGLLSKKMGGPGVYPPQPQGCMNLGQSRRKWTASSGEDRYRRAVYTYRWRATPHPALNVFDTPDAFASCTRRVRSNTPLQALTLLNDPAFFEISQGFAERLIQEGGNTDETRIEMGFRLCLARKPSAYEVSILKSFLNKQRTLYTDVDTKTLTLVAQRTNAPVVPESDRNEQAAWTMLARVLLNLDETITRE